MKRLISSVLALSLLGATVATAANAAPVNRPIPVRDYRHGNDNGAAIAAGIGFVALAAILASQSNRDHDNWNYRDRSWDYRDNGYNRGYDRGYNRDYYQGRRFDNRYDAYSHGYRSW
jgi:hypothetical protein